MDPLADKVLMAAAFVVLMDVDRSTMPAWLVIAVLAREFLVTGLRLVASSRVDSGGGLAGKTKDHLANRIRQLSPRDAGL